MSGHLKILSYMLLSAVVLCAESQVDFQMGSHSSGMSEGIMVSAYLSGAPQGVFLQSGSVYYSAGLLVDFSLDNHPFHREKKLLAQKPFLADQVLELLVEADKLYKISYIDSRGKEIVLRKGYGDGSILSFQFSEIKRFSGFGFLKIVNAGVRTIRLVQIY